MNLEELRARRAAMRTERASLGEELRGITDRAVTEKRGLTDDESASRASLRFRIAAIDEGTADIDARIVDLEAAETRAAAARAVGARASLDVSEPALYRRGGEHSYLRDIAAVQLNMSGAAEANARLAAHAKHERDGVTTTGGAAGFAVPKYLLDEAVTLARPGRPTANILRAVPFVPGTPTVSLPRVTTGTTVDDQTEGGAGSQTDVATDDVSATTRTLVGLSKLTQQTLDQTGGNFDQIVIADLLADRAAKLDLKVLTDSRAGSYGLLNIPGVNAVTYTDASPTVAKVWSKIGAASAAVYNGIYMPATAIVMAPTRWEWFASATDSNGRPLLPIGPALNAIGDHAGNPVTEGLVGSIKGLPVYVDAQVPQNLGAGTNEDVIVVLRASDVLLAEGGVAVEAFRETYADTAHVLWRLFGYHQVHSTRRPKAVSVISGTGMAVPTL